MEEKKQDGATANKAGTIAATYNKINERLDDIQKTQNDINDRISEREECPLSSYKEQLDRLNQNLANNTHSRYIHSLVLGLSSVIAFLFGWLGMHVGSDIYNEMQIQEYGGMRLDSLESQCEMMEDSIRTIAYQRDTTIAHHDEVMQEELSRWKTLGCMGMWAIDNALSNSQIDSANEWIKQELQHPTKRPERYFRKE